jgi:hypothetical protein
MSSTMSNVVLAGAFIRAAPVTVLPWQPWQYESKNACPKLAYVSVEPVGQSVCVDTPPAWSWSSQAMGSSTVPATSKRPIQPAFFMVNG